MNLNSLSILKTQAIAHQEKNVALEQGINKDYDTYKVLEQEGIAMADEHKRKEEERCNFLDKCSEVDEEVRSCTDTRACRVYCVSVVVFMLPSLSHLTAHPQSHAS
jgi:hypothetical protein